ncbi:DUF3990 domain-containing protein [Clostridium sp.]|uniref:DUF3990 domain-containing protein n=1 Tax=Clostridium sp. TaxID=1506 RepID=UPI0025C2A025|nr:DUF3990 domain-containing protein [Clostridium sp.]
MNKSLEIIYHASYTKIELPEISKIKYPKDFSFGFYCTLTKEEAEYLALKYTTPTVNVYKISNPSSLSIKVFEDYGDEWLDFVISCRNGNTHKYDVVIGPIADDTIYDYIEAYSSNQMNKSYFYESMKSKYSVHQISFHTIKALCSICFIESYEIH